jgi:hypothetical protein
MSRNTIIVLNYVSVQLFLDASIMYGKSEMTGEAHNLISCRDEPQLI